MSIFGNESRIQIFQYHSLGMNQNSGRYVLPINCDGTGIMQKRCLVTEGASGSYKPPPSTISEGTFACVNQCSCLRRTSVTKT
jgi:hypothetical protein